MKIAVATPFRSVCDDHARILARHDLLRGYYLATRRGTGGIPGELTRLNPAIGLLSYAAARMLPVFPAESFRFRLHPWYDQWVCHQLTPGDSIISSYGYTNRSFQFVRQHGGKTFLDGGNSHPENFWEIVSEEHRRWGISQPPVSRHHYERSKASVACTDYVLSPSAFVTKSFTSRGFGPERILLLPYPVNLDCFKPASQPRPKDRPLTIISTGSISLRKGYPYLFEAFRLVLKSEPTARLMLTDSVAESMRPLMARYSDLPFEWAPPLPHDQLAERLRSSDIFALLSLEDGFGRTVTEAISCGLPTVVTPNTGAADFVVPGKNGSVVPIRDPQAAANAILYWWERLRTGKDMDNDRSFLVGLSSAEFERKFLAYLQRLQIPCA